MGTVRPPKILKVPRWRRGERITAFEINRRGEVVDENFRAILIPRATHLVVDDDAAAGESEPEATDDATNELVVEVHKAVSKVVAVTRFEAETDPANVYVDISEPISFTMERPDGSRYRLDFEIEA